MKKNNLIYAAAFLAAAFVFTGCGEIFYKFAKSEVELADVQYFKFEINNKVGIVSWKPPENSSDWYAGVLIMVVEFNNDGKTLFDTKEYRITDPTQKEQAIDDADSTKWYIIIIWAIDAAGERSGGWAIETHPPPRPLTSALYGNNLILCNAY